MADGKEKHVKTLFVRNLPHDATTEQIESVFSEFGPLKRCFIVKEKGTERGRGFGYVTFSLREDAETASGATHTLNGRRLGCSFAKEKPKKKKASKTETIEEEPVEPTDTGDKDTEETVVSPVQERPKKKKKKKRNNVENTTETASIKGKTAAATVVLKGFKKGVAKAKLQHLLKQSGIMERAELTFPVEGWAPPAAFVRFQNKKEAVQATRILQKWKPTEIMDGSLSVLRLSQMEILTIPKNLKQCRLIVRNLSFKCKEEDLRKEFSMFGELTEVKIPIKPDGKMFGFGFVQFLKIADANKALTEKNAKPILGRPVAVDWAVPKSKYVDAIGKPGDGKAESSTDQTLRAANEEDDNSESDESQEEKDEEMKSDNEEAEVSKEITSDSGEDEDDDDGDDLDEGEKEPSNSDSCNDDTSDNDTDDDDTDDGDTGENKQSKERTKKNMVPRKTDVNQGRTLFIRNLPFDAEEEDLDELFEPYGELCYCRIVMDQKTEHSRGCAFVQYKEKSYADECLKCASDEQGAGLVLEGRRLNVTVAVPREKAKELKKPGVTKESKDNRNLYLVREGLIRPGTQAAQGLAQADLTKRMKIETVKRQKLKNENIFVSTTRLCVHNIPVRVDDKQLKTIFLKAADDRKAHITECRVMRDMTQVNSQGVGKSRGFAFVNFTEHTHAIQALRSTNNCPEIFGEKKRPIVEFSLENKLALLAKEKRMERMKTKQAMLSNRTDGDQSSRNMQRKSKKLKTDVASVTKATVDAKPESDLQKSKGPKGLPSHWGPKIRHKPRPAPPPAKKPKKQVAQKRSNSERREMSNAPSKQKRRRIQTDDFDKLVHKYQQKLTKAMTGVPNKKSTNTKWFDT